MLVEVYIYENWDLDSRASKHMTGNKDLLTDLKPIKTLQVITADGAVHESKMAGNANIKIEGETIKLNKVYYVPGLSSNLISVSTVTDNKYDVIFNKNAAIIRKGDLQVRIKKTFGVFTIPVQRIVATDDY
jgi:hypothetical protein